MADAKVDMALDDIIKKNRRGPGNRRGGRGGNTIQRRGGNNQRGNRGGRIGKGNNNNFRNGGNFRRGGGGGGGGNRISFGQRNNNNNNNRGNNFRQRRGGRGNSIPGFNRRNVGGDKPTATYNPLSRDGSQASSKQFQPTQTAPRKQQGSVFNKIRPKQQNVTALRRRMVAAQRALTRATKTLAALPRLKQQRQRFLQQPPKLRNIITRNRVGGGGVGGIRKRLSTGRKQLGRGGSRRMFV